ncbi:MAG: secretin and TonB N-terminal domain-containing protein, partial [Bacteroidales bacterium]|nr:secretin and TonB N-terminal domain-containing protein [Bacteroidales bacterium]
MRYACLLACVGIFGSWGELNAQSRKISFTYRDVPLKTILKDIEDQSFYSFVYSDKIDVNKTVTLRVVDLELDEALKMLFAAVGLNYKITDTYVVVYHPDATSARQAAQQNIRITGVVTDETGQPMPGVNVTLKGTMTGVISDHSGKYA